MSAPFVWDGRDIADASQIAYRLATLKDYEHAAAVLDSSADLQCQAPREADAWRYFHAARKIVRLDSVAAARAHALGRRIALAATGLEVIDGHRVEVGASVAFVFGHFPRPMGAR